MCRWGVVAEKSLYGNNDKKGGRNLDNPFLKGSVETGGQYLTPECSVNKIRLAKLPVRGVDDAIEGLTVKEFFSNKLIISDIKKNADALHIDIGSVHEKKLPHMLNLKADDDADPSGAAAAREIMTKFGNRLGLMLLSLKLGETENREARPDWNERHWDYWAQVSDIVLVGGLASGRFGEILREQVEYVFALADVKPYRILLYKNAPQAALLGCASCIKGGDGVYVVMDFGQTGIKRSCLVKRSGEIESVRQLESLPSKYMEWNDESGSETERQAKQLHAYLVSAAESAYLEASREMKAEPQGELVISIASYTKDGALNSARSGYAKLCTLGANYAEILAWELSGRFRRDITVRLIHDGTAVALNFNNRKDTVCLSVGSYFGIGFPETKIV